MLPDCTCTKASQWAEGTSLPLAGQLVMQVSLPHGVIRGHGIKTNPVQVVGVEKKMPISAIVHGE